jgi:predicted nucleic acid-binding protein
LKVVVDASVALKWFLAEADASRAALLLRRAERLAAPELLLLECADVLTPKMRKREIDAVALSDAFRLLTGGAIDLVPDRDLALDAATIATATGATVYDACYIALAERTDAIVVTADAKLRRRTAATPLAGRVRLLDELEDQVAR